MKQFEVKRRQIEYLSKVLELVLFLIIERRIGLEGAGFFLVALVLFTVDFTVFGKNLPDALGKIIRARKAKGQYQSIIRIRIMALLFQLFLGVIGMLCMLLFGTLLGEKIFNCPYASIMIWILSPLVFLRSMTFLYLGYCQGEGFELPAVISCIVRPVLIYFFGNVFGTMVGSYGEKVSLLLKQEHFTAMYTAAGWCGAFCIAELCVFLFVFLSFIGTRKKNQGGETESMKASVSMLGYIGAVLRNMRFKTLIQVLEMLPIVITMMIFYHREGEKAPLTYGTYFVGYFAICLMLYYLLCAVIVPFWGKIYGFMKQSDRRMARVTFQGGIHLVLVLGAAFSVTLAAMPAHVGDLAGFSSPNLVKVLAPGGFWVVFMAMAFYFSRTLMRLKKNTLCIGIAAVCDILYIMVFLIFWKDEKMGILALMYAGLITAVVYAFLLGAVAIPMFGGRINIITVFVLPIAGAAIMGGIQYVCVKLFGMYLKDLYMVLSVGLIGILLYICVLLILRNFGEEEFEVLPLLRGFGEMLGVY